MPIESRTIPMRAVGVAELRRISELDVPRSVRQTFEFKRPAQGVPVRAAIRDWQKAVKAPPAIKNPEVRIKAWPPVRRDLTRLRKVVEAGLAPAVMKRNSMDTEDLFGSLFSALATHEFMKLEAEYRLRLARPGARRAVIERQWQSHVQEFSRAFAAAGLPNVGEADLRIYLREFNANKANRDAIIAIADSGHDASEFDIAGNFVPVASIVPVTGVLLDPSVIVTSIKDLCDDPISEGRYTKHFSHSISLSVRIPYPCVRRWKLRWCHKTVTLAGVSFGVSVDVGYRLTCCGATVWGQGGARVCATIVGKSVCAACSATIVGVAGVARTPVATGCQYGLGINATLRCTLAGATILNMSAPFGWTITGPCPPAGLC